MTGRIDFRSLTRPQRNALARIAINDDSALNPRTAAALEQLGLIEGRDVVMPGNPPVRVRRFFVPLPVHIQWCAFCSEAFTE